MELEITESTYIDTNIKPGKRFSTWDQTIVCFALFFLWSRPVLSDISITARMARLNLDSSLFMYLEISNQSDVKFVLSVTHPSNIIGTEFY